MISSALPNANFTKYYQIVKQAISIWDTDYDVL